MIDLFSGAESCEYHSQVSLFYCSMGTAVQRTSTPVPNAKPVHITFVLVSRLNKVLALGSSVFVMDHFYEIFVYVETQLPRSALLSGFKNCEQQ